MTVDIKESWFQMNKKPSKLRRIAKKYKKRGIELVQFFNTSRKYGIKLSDDVIQEIITGWIFNSRQGDKLNYYADYLETGNEKKLAHFKELFKDTKETIREKAKKNIWMAKEHGSLIYVG